ncbi:MAG: hypothetical protein ACEQSH_00700 [Bacteroidia bacterium]
MTTKYWPVNDHRWGVRDFVMWPTANVWAPLSVIGKQTHTRSLTGKRWMCSFTLRAATWRERAAVGAFLDSLEQGGNRLSMWHLARPLPYGTITGSPTIASALSIGDKTAIIQTDPGMTVVAGDLLGVAGQLIKAETDATANGSGVLTMPLVHGVRKAATVGAAVTVERPSCLWIPVGEIQSDAYVQGHAPAIPLQFAEAYE